MRSSEWRRRSEARATRYWSRCSMAGTAGLVTTARTISRWTATPGAGFVSVDRTMCWIDPTWISRASFADGRLSYQVETADADCGRRTRDGPKNEGPRTIDIPLHGNGN